jgi:hypothetical protein
LEEDRVEEEEVAHEEKKVEHVVAAGYVASLLTDSRWFTSQKRGNPFLYRRGEGLRPLHHDPIDPLGEPLEETSEPMETGPHLLGQGGRGRPQGAVQVIQSKRLVRDFRPVIVNVVPPGVSQGLADVDPKVGAGLYAVEDPVQLRLLSFMSMAGSVGSASCRETITGEVGGDWRGP